MQLQKELITMERLKSCLCSLHGCIRLKEPHQNGPSWAYMGGAQQWLRREGFGLGANGVLGPGIADKWLFRHDTDKPVLYNWGGNGKLYI